MRELVTSLLRPLIALFILILGSGLSNTYTILMLENASVDHSLIGFVSAALYFGTFIGSLKLDRVITKWGLASSFIIFALIISLSLFLQALWFDSYFWGVLRFIGGVCSAGIFIVIEGWLLIQAPDHLRGFILSIYLAVFYLALSLGQLLIHFSHSQSNAIILFTAFLTLFSLLPMLNIKNKQLPANEHVTIDSKRLFNLCSFGLSGVLISGVMLASMYSLIPVYAKHLGLLDGEIGNLMSVLILGGLLFQWPATKLAQTNTRKTILLFTAVLAGLLSLIIAETAHISNILLYTQIFLLGGFTFTIYPLSMAYASEKLKSSELISATGGFVFSYGFGAILGPIIAPQVMNLLGIKGLFYFLGLMGLILGFVGTLNWKTKSDPEAF